jgi:hypothetical protein
MIGPSQIGNVLDILSEFSSPLKNESHSNPKRQRGRLHREIDNSDRLAHASGYVFNNLLDET